jgi:hypothetical protein
MKKYRVFKNNFISAWILVPDCESGRAQNLSTVYINTILAFTDHSTNLGVYAILLFFMNVKVMLHNFGNYFASSRSFRTMCSYRETSSGTDNRPNTEVDFHLCDERLHFTLIISALLINNISNGIFETRSNI